MILYKFLVKMHQRNACDDDTSGHTLFRGLFIARDTPGDNTCPGHTKIKNQKWK